MTSFRSTRSICRVLSTIAALFAVTTCRDYEGPASPARAPDRSTPGFDVSPTSLPVTATLVGAGNIASCSTTGDEATASVLDTIPGTVMALGDNAYSSGTLTQYNTCYGPSWGRRKADTRPAVGDLDYKTTGASGYFTYFGAAAGDPKKGYYSYDLGAWHIVVLNSNSSKVPTAAGSAQEQWLRADLAAHPARCTLAYWHHPLFDSKDNPNTAITPLWNALYAAGVDVVVNAHYGFYERFAPQTPAGKADPAQGIREFIVGTGGAATQSFGTVRANSEVRSSGTPGVLKLTLDLEGYAWEFVPIAGKTFRDRGTAACHGAPLAVKAGPDVVTTPGDTVRLSVTLTDPNPNPAPWGYTIAWGDGGTSSGAAQASPFTASHVYAAVGLNSARVTVTNSTGTSGADTVAVSVVAPAVLVGAGDIADCATTWDSVTATLLDSIPGTVFTLGDNAYPNGSSTDYNNCYVPTWGRHKARTRPVPGNHDYLTTGASGYFNYFGSAAGPSGKGYYSYNLGDWHIVALNSNIAMTAGSAQEKWLRGDLATNKKRCTLAYWHHPLFSSSVVETMPDARALWQDLYNAGAEVVLVGHHHDYERFAPQTPAAVADDAHGIRQFVVGTGGGEGLFALGATAPNSEVRDNNTFGVLKLTLKPSGYTWEFIPVPGRSFTDAGSGSCHGAPPTGTNHAPTAVAGGPYSGVQGELVTFDGSGSSDPDGDGISYAWTFGDGSTGTGVQPGHTYASTGSYTVTLTVTDVRGATSTRSTTTATIAPAPPKAVLLAAGNVASCTINGDEATAQILDTIPGTVMALGDNAFPDGTLADYHDCYGPSWGAYKANSYAVLGNHEYQMGNADGSFDYFGDRAGPRGKGYYSFDLGAWHIIVLNSHADYVSFSAGSEQDLWLQQDLAANTKQCVLAAWHNPRFFSSNTDGWTSSFPIKIMWERLYAAGADVVLNGQQHDYERFAPQDPNGAVDPTYGIREFNVGTGGEGVVAQAVIAANSEIRGAALGVLKLTLYDDHYTWAFRPVQGQTFTDAGSGNCHAAPPGYNRLPTAAPGGPYSGTEGAAVTFDGSASSDPDGDALTYAWSFGDGTSGIGAQPTHTYADNGSYTVTLTVTDARGTASAPVNTTATIANAAPAVNAGGYQRATTGTSFTLNPGFSDPGTSDGPWAYAIAWGDGTETTGSRSDQGGTFAVAHTYATGGTNTVRVTVTDKDRASGSDEITVEVSADNRAPTAMAGGPYSAADAVSFDGSGSSDPDGDALTYAWSFGDGGSGTGATPTHAYANGGTYTVTLTVTDAWGAVSAPATTTATINKLALLAAGNVASCTINGDEATAQILDTIPGTVMALGDNAFPNGTLADYQNCYGPSWGQFKANSYAVLGNHEYQMGNADGSFDYFGDRAGPRGKGYYSFDLGAWHIIVLNSHADYVPFSAGSEQDLWLQADLARNTKQCILAAWHNPRFFSSNSNGWTSSAPIKIMWDRLYAAGADIVLNGQQHDYERFAPQDPSGAVDLTYGIREFNVGTGGEGTTMPAFIAPNSEAIGADLGVLKLTLYDNRYTWQFVSVSGRTFTDAGSGTCHGAPPGFNHAPAAAPGGPYSGTEGAAVSFDGSGSSDPDGDALTYAWSFGDGTSGSGAQPSHTYADNGSYTVTLTVSDGGGASSAPVTTTATIGNAAPTVNAGGDQPATLGSPFVLNARFSDAGGNDATWSYAINWGDGSEATSGSTTSQSNPITAEHVYAAGGTNTVTVTVTDKDGASGSGQATVTVSADNRAPSAAIGGPYSGTEAAAVSFDGSGSSDPDADALTYAWSFGDGATGSGAQPSHTYADNGSYTVTLTVTDTHGAWSSATTTTTVANAAPSVSAGADRTLGVRSTLTVSAGFSDAGANDGPWSYSIDWRDGSAATTGSTNSQSGTITAAHTYTVAGTYAVLVTVTDKDAGAGSGTLTATVFDGVTLAGAGDIARLRSSPTRIDAEATAALLDGISGTVFTLGDAAYDSGTVAEYNTQYDPTWGRHKARTYPVPGDKDYKTAGASGYFTYFGAAAGDPSKGYYSYDLGAWHIIMLNSSTTSTTAPDNAQLQWLGADLRANTRRCVLAMWHEPRFSSSASTGNNAVRPFWDSLYAAGAEVVLNAHVKRYERYAPQTPVGIADPTNGIREFIVGTGGEALELTVPNTSATREAIITGVFGVLKLTLGDGIYSWEFIPVAGQTATDSGIGSCH